MSEALTDWILGIAVCVLMWLLAFSSQRSARTRSERVPIPRWLAWVSGYPKTEKVDAGSFGYQFLALSVGVANTLLVLAIPAHEVRIAGLILASIGLLLVTLVLVEWLRRRHA